MEEDEVGLCRVVAFLREEGMMARNLSHAEPNEEQRMYRIGQHDALILASDEIEKWDAQGSRP